MERLTTRNSAGVAVLKTPYQCERCGEVIYRLADYGSGEPIEKLAGYEDLQEQGRLLKLPCAEGDTVYRVERFCSLPLDCPSRPCKYCSNYPLEINEERFLLKMLENIGITVFLTHEEAEEALKRMEDGK